MKMLFVIIVAFSVLFAIGCRENSITEPAGTLEKSADRVTEGIIKLNFVIDDPLAGSVQLVGNVYFVHNGFSLNQDSGQLQVSLSLEMNSELTDMLGMTHLEWNSSGKSEDSIFMNTGGIYILDKTYSITNRNDVMLVIKYLITTEGVSVHSAWLEQDYTE